MPCSTESAPARTASLTPDGAVGMDRDLVPERVRGVDDRLHLVERHRLRGVDAVEAAARAVDLDPVGAGLDPILGVLRHRLGIGRPAPARAEMPWPATNIRGPDHRAHGDEIAHREVGLARRAEIADRRHAGLERPPRVVLREKDRDRRPAALAERPRSRLAIPVVGDVGVEIDQARERGVAAQVDGAVGRLFLAARRRA